MYVLMLVYGRHFMPNSQPPLHAGCVEALSKDRALLLAFWTVHRPPSAAALALALRLLHALAASPPAAWAAAAQGGVVYLMTSLLPVTPAPAHEAVCLCFISLLWLCANCAGTVSFRYCDCGSAAWLFASKSASSHQESFCEPLEYFPCIP